MSILLDALRKSENSQKPVESPTIHGSDHQLQEPESIKSSYVVLLIIVALVLIGWLLWKQYHAEEAAYRPPVELPAGKTTSQVTPQELAPQTSANTASGRPRTPVETYEMTKAEAEAATLERKALEAAATEAKRAQVRSQSRSEPLKPVSRKSSPPSSGASQASEQTTGDGSIKRPSGVDRTVAADGSGSQGKSTKSSTTAYQSPEPEPISYWELPDSVRNGVPEIKFSVLVYAEQAENRFVLINGERLIERDELKPGLVVEHIRRDGVVFSYQMYQFFVKR